MHRIKIILIHNKCNLHYYIMHPWGTEPKNYFDFYNYLHIVLTKISTDEDINRIDASITDLSNASTNQCFEDLNLNKEQDKIVKDQCDYHLKVYLFGSV